MLKKYKGKGEKMENEFMENTNLLILLLMLLMPLIIKKVVGQELKNQSKDETHNDDEYIEIIQSAKIELINLQHKEVDIVETIEENSRVMSRTKEYLKNNQNMMRELEENQMGGLAKQQEDTKVSKKVNNFKEMK